MRRNSNPHLIRAIQPKGKNQAKISSISPELQNAIEYFQKGELEKAASLCQLAIQLDNKNSTAFYILGLISIRVKKFTQAVELLQHAIKFNPNEAAYFCNLGIAFKGLNRLFDAIESYDKAIVIKKDFAAAYFNKAIALKELKKYTEEINSYNLAIRYQPKFEQAYLNKGIALHALKKYAEAEDCFKEALAIRPMYAEAFTNLGLTQEALKNIKDAIKSHHRAIEINPNFAEAFYNLGNALQSSKKFEESIDSYNQAIKLNQSYVEAYSNRGNVLRVLDKFKEAIESYESALRINPVFSDAVFNQGVAYQGLMQYDMAIDCYAKADRLNSEIKYLLGIRQYAKSFVCDWSLYDQELGRLKSELELNKPVASPFSPLVAFDDPRLHHQTSKAFTHLNYPLNLSLGNIENTKRSEKIKIAYYSADLYYHPVAIWLAELLENQDKSRFEIIAFSFKKVLDPMRLRFETIFNQIYDVDSMPDDEVAKLSRQIGIDIAFDLSGHTAGSRPGIFALRAAPIQVSHLGFPGTMGADYIDYFITDPHVVPEESRQFFTEKIAYVPCGYTYDRQRKVSSEHLTRAQFGLPENAFVFTCQNGCQKINPEVFDIWMDILRTIPHSVLWLLEPHPTAVKNLRNEALARGVQSERLIFTKRETVSKDQEMNRISRYLASYKLADLFLDTWPYNAGTTAIDALWAGLPVLTKSGQSVVARMATSALHAIEMPELITTTPQEYRDLAVSLASNPQRLCEIKEKVERNRLTTALFDPVTNTKYIEAAYLEMYARQQEELKPAHIVINAKCFKKS